MAYHGKYSEGTKSGATAAAGAILTGLIQGAVGVAIILGVVGLLVIAILAVVGA